VYEYEYEDEDEYIVYERIRGKSGVPVATTANEL